MLERGLTVDHTTVYRWVQAYAPELDKRCRAYLKPTNDSWGGAFEPERGEQFEIGIKQEFFDDRLSANLALYHITRQNVATTDPEDPDFEIQTGEQTSKGRDLAWLECYSHLCPHRCLCQRR